LVFNASLKLGSEKIPRQEKGFPETQASEIGLTMPEARNLGRGAPEIHTESHANILMARSATRLGQVRTGQPGWENGLAGNDKSFSAIEISQPLKDQTHEYFRALNIMTIGQKDLCVATFLQLRFSRIGFLKRLFQRFSVESDLSTYVECCEIPFKE
jgi:hypothetical protein